MRLPLGLHAIHATLGYHLGHRREVQDYLDRQRQSSTQARREAERRFLISAATLDTHVGQDRMVAVVRLRAEIGKFAR